MSAGSSGDKNYLKRWDFRYGEMPEGLSVHGHKVLTEGKDDVPLFTLQKPEGSASFLTVNPMAMLQLELASSVGNTFFNV